MFGDKSTKMKSCRNKLKEKLKGRLNAPVPLRRPFQDHPDKQNMCANDFNESFFENFHQNYQVLSQRIVFEVRNVKRRLDHEFGEGVPVKMTASAAPAHAIAANKQNQSALITGGRRSTPRQNLTERYENQTSRGTSRTISKHKSSAKVQARSNSRFKKSALLKL